MKPTPPPQTPTPVTLQTVLDRLAVEAGDGSESRKRDLCSAVTQLREAHGSAAGGDPT